METIHTTCIGNSGLRIREAGEGEAPSRTIEGFAIRFDTPSLPLYNDGEEIIREIIDRGAVTQELLDGSDIKMTLFHDNHLLLASSKRGEGSLTYELREEGVFFSFDAPHTADGDKAVELVRSGIIDGCSFAFSTRYMDPDFVERETVRNGKKRETTCRVKKITGIYDMTLTPDPAYPSTCVAARELRDLLRSSLEKEEQQAASDISEMREYLRGARL